MALFGRRNKSTVPAEIQEYYQTERRDRAGVAWLLALGTLIITIVLATGIFFAGRWAYRAAFDNDDKPTETTQEEEKKPEDQSAATNQTEEQKKAEEARQAEENKKREEAERQAEQDAEKKKQEEAAAAAKQEQERQQAAATQQPAQSGQVAGTSNIPNTGPGETVAVFAGVSVFGYIAHRLFGRRSDSRR